jgi:hypothetical protein
MPAVVPPGSLALPARGIGVFKRIIDPVSKRYKCHTGGSQY